MTVCDLLLVAFFVPYLSMIYSSAAELHITFELCLRGRRTSGTLFYPCDLSDAYIFLWGILLLLIRRRVAYSTSGQSDDLVVLLFVRWWLS